MLDSRSSGSGLDLESNCVVFLGKTFYFHRTSFHLRVIAWRTCIKFCIGLESAGMLGRGGEWLLYSWTLHVTKAGVKLNASIDSPRAGSSRSFFSARRVFCSQDIALRKRRAINATQGVVQSVLQAISGSGGLFISNRNFQVPLRLPSCLYNIWLVAN